MTLPRPVKAVIDFVLALSATLDKGPAPSVRAPGDRIVPQGLGFCWECHQFVRTIPTTCRDKCCEGVEFYASHYGRHFTSPLCPGSGTRVAPDAKPVGEDILERWFDERPMEGWVNTDRFHRAATRLPEGKSSAPGPRKPDYAPMGTGENVCLNHERSQICNMRWANTTVLLGDTNFIRCRFFNCKLIDDGPFSMERCYTENCTIQSKDSYEKTSLSVRSRR
jgi:hypothetical protein